MSNVTEQDWKQMYGILRDAVDGVFTDEKDSETYENTKKEFPYALLCVTSFCFLAYCCWRKGDLFERRRHDILAIFALLTYYNLQLVIYFPLEVYFKHHMGIIACSVSTLLPFQLFFAFHSVGFALVARRLATVLNQEISTSTTVLIAALLHSPFLMELVADICRMKMGPSPYCSRTILMDYDSIYFDIAKVMELGVLGMSLVTIGFYYKAKNDMDNMVVSIVAVIPYMLNMAMSLDLLLYNATNDNLYTVLLGKLTVVLYCLAAVFLIEEIRESASELLTIWKTEAMGVVQKVLGQPPTPSKANGTTELV